MGRDSNFFAGSTVRLLRSPACQPGALLVTLPASSGSAGMLLTVQDSQCMSGALFVAFFADSAYMSLARPQPKRGGGVSGLSSIRSTAENHAAPIRLS